MTILAVDDDPDDLSLFTEALYNVNPNFVCVHARNGIEALSILENVLPDVLFLDLNMPKMGGKECLLKIRSIDHLKNIPIVIYSTASDEISFYKKHNAEFLKKAVSFDETIKSLKDVFDKL